MREPAYVGMLQVKDILVKGKGEQQQAVGVRLADGRVFRGKAVVSNATRWDTFEKLLAHEEMPKSERLFRQASCAVPSERLSGFQASASHGLPPSVSGRDCLWLTCTRSC